MDFKRIEIIFVITFLALNIFLLTTYFVRVTMTFHQILLTLK